MESIAQLDGPYVIFEGKKFLDFSSYDFLGLAQHPEVKKNSIKYALKYGVGTPPIPLTSTVQREVEAKLAHYLGKETALLFPSEAELYVELEKAGATVVSTEESPSGQKKSKGLKVADDTFLLGIHGSSGFGSASQVDIVCGSLAAGLGGSGAFIAGPKKQIGAFQPSSPLSYPVLGALDSALIFVPEMETERKMVQKNRSWLLKQLEKFDVQELASPRIFLSFASKEDAESIRQFFLQEQIYLAPAVDKRLYFSTTALHTPDDLDQFATALKKLAATDLALAMQSLTPAPAR